MINFRRYSRRGVIHKDEQQRDSSAQLQFFFVLFGRQFKSMREPTCYRELLLATKALTQHQIGSRFDEWTTLNLQCGQTEICVDSEATFDKLSEQVWKVKNEDIYIIISQQAIIGCKAGGQEN